MIGKGKKSGLFLINCFIDEFNVYWLYVLLNI